MIGDSLNQIGVLDAPARQDQGAVALLVGTYAVVHVEAPATAARAAPACARRRIRADHSVRSAAASDSRCAPGCGRPAPRGRTGTTPHHRALRLHGLHQRQVFRYLTDVVECHVQITIGYALQAAKQQLTLTAFAHHVGEHAKLVHAALTAEHLDQRISVGEGGRLIAQHHQHLLRRLTELQYRLANPGGGIDDQHLERLGEGGEGLDDPCLLGASESCHTRHARGCWHHAHARAALHNHLFQRALPAQHVLERVARRQAEHHINVGETEIAIEQQRAPSCLGKSGGEIDRHGALAGAALAASNRDDLHRRQCRGACPCLKRQHSVDLHSGGRAARHPDSIARGAPAPPHVPPADGRARAADLPGIRAPSAQ